MNFWIKEAICVAMQIVGFFPFFLIWRKDCKEIGKDNLAVSLGERIVTWIAFCPFWMVPILQMMK